ncbi:hypothetical protein EYF80_044298 [Liparis tanakae]|uniref:Uncharacterized protein n=1 Tax=Liparis tanakae TaxID=230148 RepID=A0A4Z2FY97_9TELE|nr:hypothetical protein EYF80_044298 [Liparis tanakae]
MEREGGGTLRMSKKKTPVLEKVQGRMAGVLRKENWPNPREGESMKRRSVGTDVEVEQGPFGDEVPATWAPEAGSAAETSPWEDGTPPPRSMKRDRSFFSRAWMSSGRAAACGWEWTAVGWTDGAPVVPG